MDRYSYRNGWPGAPGIGLLPLSSCGCNDFPAQPCSPFPPFCENGCPILLDSACVIYHKNMNTPTGLINLNLPNGTTAELIFNTIDSYLGVLNVGNWSLPYLTGKYGSMTTIRQFGQNVDTELSSINTAITNINTNLTPLSSTPTSTVAFTFSGTLNHNISATVKVSATTPNQLSVLSDGLYSAPQTLIPNYSNKTLTISNGNTVDLTSLVCGVSGFLGNLTADPTAIDGQYWYNTTSAQLKIHLNGAVRVITIV